MGSGAAEKSTKQSRAEGKAGNMREKHRRGVCAIKKGVQRQGREVCRARQTEAGWEHAVHNTYTNSSARLCHVQIIR